MPGHRPRQHLGARVTDVLADAFRGVKVLKYLKDMSDEDLAQLLADYRAWLGVGPPYETIHLIKFRTQFQVPGTADHLYRLVLDEVCRRYLTLHAPERLETD